MEDELFGTETLVEMTIRICNDNCVFPPIDWAEKVKRELIASARMLRTRQCTQWNYQIWKPLSIAPRAKSIGVLKVGTVEARTKHEATMMLQVPGYAVSLWRPFQNPNNTRTW